MKFLFKKAFISLLFFSFSMVTNGQTIISLVDNESKEPIPYAVITIDSETVYSDIKGRFNLPKGDSIRVHYVGYKDFLSTMPLKTDTIFLESAQNDIREIQIDYTGKPFTSGKLVKKQSSSLSNGQLNGKPYDYFEYIVGINSECEFFKVESLNFLLPEKNKSPYRINFYKNLNEPALFSKRVHLKQKKGTVEIPIQTFFESNKIFVGFEWLPDIEYNTEYGKIKQTNDFVNYTNFSIGLSNKIKDQLGYYKVKLKGKLIPSNSNSGVALRLNCLCYDNE